jgi:hypothetical protein
MGSDRLDRHHEWLNKYQDMVRKLIIKNSGTVPSILYIDPVEYAEFPLRSIHHSMAVIILKPHPIGETKVYKALMEI